jgi:hypothetical protein
MGYLARRCKVMIHPKKRPSFTSEEKQEFIEDYLKSPLGLKEYTADKMTPINGTSCLRRVLALKFKERTMIGCQL